MSGPPPKQAVAAVAPPVPFVPTITPLATGIPFTAVPAVHKQATIPISPPASSSYSSSASLPAPTPGFQPTPSQTGFQSYYDPPVLQPRSQTFERVRQSISVQFQRTLDESTPWVISRWGFTFCALMLYCGRIYLLGGWYIITYALGIYILNLLIGFLSPQIDPETEIGEDTEMLPSRSDDEFRPFIRRLPEFKFWYSLTRAVLISFFCTFFGFLNIPVFWPILLLYFIALFAVTMKKQIRHMIKYKYVPFSWGKPKFSNKSRSSD